MHDHYGAAAGGLICLFLPAKSYWLRRLISQTTNSATLCSWVLSALLGMALLSSCIMFTPYLTDNSLLGSVPLMGYIRSLLDLLLLFGSFGSSLKSRVYSAKKCIVKVNDTILWHGCLVWLQLRRPVGDA